MKHILFSTFFVALLLLGYVSGASAHADSGDELVFPVWTYWVEIVEHIVMLVISLATVFFLSKSLKPKFKNLTSFAIAGFVFLALSQSLTALQHFLIFPFGILTSIIGHGALLVAIVLISFTVIKFSRRG